MAKKRYDICWGQRDQKDEKKVHWKQIGVVLQTDKGFSMKLEMIPAGWDGWAQLFEPRAKEETAKPADKAGDAGDVPF
jgi:hypothetical protein